MPAAPNVPPGGEAVTEGPVLSIVKLKVALKGPTFPAPSLALTFQKYVPSGVILELGVNVGDDSEGSDIVSAPVKVFSLSTSNSYVTGVLGSLIAFEVNVGVLSLIVAAFAGALSVGAPGKAISMVNENVAP